MAKKSAIGRNKIIYPEINGGYRQFIQIPGPNPILVPGDEKDWDGGVIESCNVFKDKNTYYLYYHAMPKDTNFWSPLRYRIGVATALHPLGPWTKYDKNPIIDVGPKGNWDDFEVACAAVIKEEADKYYMWYSGRGQHSKRREWNVGLATADSPLGPWKKYETNPVLTDFGYIGGVVKVKSKYYMYSEYPIGLTSPDAGPIALATAQTPEGPWEKYKGNPVISPDDWGSWDDGGFSEAGVTYHDGIFHIFYSGIKWEKIENIGYAYSFDGHNFTKYPGNPVALRERNPDASAFAETHALWEPPFIYLYHTLRYISRGGMYTDKKENAIPDEDIGVQILVTNTPFRLSMPVLSVKFLNAGTGTSLNTCSPTNLEYISVFALRVECTYHSKAKNGLRLHIKASHDGIKYDTEDLYAFDNNFKPGQTTSKTTELSPATMFVKVIVENLDKSQKIADINVTAILGHI